MSNQKKIESLELEKCEFDDMCDFCKNPKKGSYAYITGCECRDTEYYICGDCALSALKGGIEHASELRPFQFINLK